MLHAQTTGSHPRLLSLAHDERARVWASAWELPTPQYTPFEPVLTAPHVLNVTTILQFALPRCWQDCRASSLARSGDGMS